MSFELREDQETRWCDTLGPLSSGRPGRQNAGEHKAGAVRRKTEDILEASRLEQEALYEVWE